MKMLQINERSWYVFCLSDLLPLNVKNYKHLKTKQNKTHAKKRCVCGGGGGGGLGRRYTDNNKSNPMFLFYFAGAVYNRL